MQTVLFTDFTIVRV